MVGRFYSAQGHVPHVISDILIRISFPVFNKVCIESKLFNTGSV
jgi:predicted amidohydrolase